MNAYSPSKDKRPRRHGRGTLPFLRRIVRQPLMWMFILGMALAAFAFLGGGLKFGLVGLTVFWLLAEACFVAFQSNRLKAHNRTNIHQVPHHDPEETFLKFLNLKGHISIQSFLSGWFHDVAFEEIKRGNLFDLIAYGFYYKSREEVEGTALEDVIWDHVGKVEKHYEVQLQDGRNPSVTFMAHLWEPLKVHFRPLAFYVGMELLGLVSHLIMLVMGFRPQEHNRVTYWIRNKPPALQPEDNGTAKNCLWETSIQPTENPPLLFIHGVGFGLMPYLAFLCRIMIALPDTCFILMECRHVAMRLCWESPHVDDLAHGVVAVLERHGFCNACFMAHSYGTLLMTRCLQLHPGVCSSAVLIDPVSLLVLHPKLLGNFVYNKASMDSRQRRKDILRYLVATEMTVAETMCRKFWWHTFMTWPDLLPRSTIVVLSAMDNLVPLPEVESMLSSTGAQVLHHPEHHHGDFLFDGQWQDEIVERMHKFQLEQKSNQSSFVSI